MECAYHPRIFHSPSYPTENHPTPGISSWNYPFVVMLRLSALLYIHIDIMEFVHMVMIKVTSCPELVPPVTVIDPKTEVIDTYKRRGREWYIACLK